MTPPARGRSSPRDQKDETELTDKIDSIPNLDPWNNAASRNVLEHI
mgnify:CR=1 FL=1